MNLLNNFMFVGALEFKRNMIFTAIRQFFALIAAIFYGFISIILQIVLAVGNLDNAPMFQEYYQKIQDRFYVIIGVVMLFKMTVSLITYFANPDKITDKEMGAGKLVTRFITVLILLIFVPQYVFPFLGRIQVPLLDTVGKVVLETNTTVAADDVGYKGELIATTIFSGFFKPHEGCGGAEVTSGIFTTAVDLAEEACSDSKDTYKYDFDFVSAIVCVIPIIVLLVIIGVQVAIRAFKLILLKIIAPIPIISYMDPKSAKDGGKTSVYIKMFMTAYIDLFIHFGALYFVIEICDKIFGTNALDAAGDLLGLARETLGVGLVFVVIGLLLFAFQAPKFVKKALGLKDSEFGSGLAGLLTTTASVAGMVGSGVAGFSASAAATGGGHLIQNVGAGISSAIRGGSAGYKAAGEKGDYTKVLGAIRDKNLQMATERSTGSTAGGRMRTSLSSMFLGQTEFAADEKRLKDLKAQETAAKQLKEYAIGEGKKKTAHIEQTMNVAGKTQNISLDQLNEAINYANSQNGDGHVHFADGSSYAVGSSVINKLLGDLEEGAGTLYAQQVDQGLLDDPGALNSFRGVLADSLGTTVDGLKHYTKKDNQGNAILDGNGNPIEVDLTQNVVDIKTIQKQTSTLAFELENSKAYAQHKADAQMSGKK